jgi:hypothetical protein
MTRLRQGFPKLWGFDESGRGRVGISRLMIFIDGQEFDEARFEIAEKNLDVASFEEAGPESIR